MSFSFPPMTEEEIKSLTLVDDGVYDFEVVSATQKLSKSKNQMIELKLKIWDIQGREHLIFDYLVSTSTMMYKVRHFCYSVGMEKQYEEGIFDVSQCEGARGKAEVIIKKGDPKEGGGVYPDKNAVRDYIPLDPNSIEKISKGKLVTENKKEFIDDDIPF